MTYMECIGCFSDSEVPYELRLVVISDIYNCLYKRYETVKKDPLGINVNAKIKSYHNICTEIVEYLAFKKLII